MLRLAVLIRKTAVVRGGQIGCLFGQPAVFHRRVRLWDSFCEHEWRIATNLEYRHNRNTHDLFGGTGEVVQSNDNVFPASRGGSVK